ncbi:class I SAM-dependent methyltransferase [Methanococcus sp. CF]
MKCKICNCESNEVFTAKILNKYDIKYYHCDECGFLQTENPYWIDEAYSQPINSSDTGYMRRNIHLSYELIILLFLFFNTSGKYVDYAGGYGVFVRLMRDIGYDFYWQDKYAKNLFSNGFEWKCGNVDAVTTFESFEHFENPLEDLEKILSISRNIIFSTTLLPKKLPKPDEWWYYGLDHGQHVSFYSKKTFKYIAKKYGLNYSNIGSLHLLTEKKIPKFLLPILKLRVLGIHNVLKIGLKSKTWSDYLLMSRKK